MKAPRSLRVLVTPSATFREALAEAKGFGTLFLLLGIEYALIEPVGVITALVRVPGSPLGAIGTLWSQFLHYALPPIVGVLALSLLLYYFLRFRDKRSLDLWAAASVLAYTWVPHVLVVALATLLVGLGLDFPLLPYGGTPNASLSEPLRALRFFLAFGPSLGLAWIALRAVREPKPKQETVATFRALSLVGGGALALILVAGSLSARGVVKRWDEVRPVMAGDHLPAMSLYGLDGGTLPLASLHGQVALVDFWATWCPPCVASLPHLERLHDELGAQGFHLVSVNVEPESLPTVRRFVSEHQLDFPVYVDGGALQQRFQVTTLPTALLVDKRGAVRQVYIGMTSEGRLRAEIQALLAEPIGS